MANKILLVRLSALGDLIQTLPIASLLRDTFPQSTLGWLVDEELAPLLMGHPDLTHVHPYPRRRWTRALLKPWQWPKLAQEIGQFFKIIAQEGYTVGLDVQGLFKSAFVLCLTGIPRRIGYANSREGSSWFYTERVEPVENDFFNFSIPHVAHMKALAMALGCPDQPLRVAMPPVPGNLREAMGTRLAEAFVQQAPIVALAPATQWTSKYWPQEYWTEMIQGLLAQTALNIVLVGGRMDRPLGHQIEHELSDAQGRVCNLMGETSIQDLLALYSLVEMAIGPDSAPLHLAGAMQVPHVIGLYGPTAYRRTGPFGSPNTVLFSTEEQLACQPCDKSVCRLGTTECMRLITPAEVLQAVCNAFSLSSASP